MRSQWKPLRTLKAHGRGPGTPGRRLAGARFHRGLRGLCGLARSPLKRSGERSGRARPLSGMARWSTRCKSEPFLNPIHGARAVRLCSCHAVWARPQCRCNARSDCVERGRAWAPDEEWAQGVSSASHLSFPRGHILWARICVQLSPRAIPSERGRGRWSPHRAASFDGTLTQTPQRPLRWEKVFSLASGVDAWEKTERQEETTVAFSFNI